MRLILLCLITYFTLLSQANAILTIEIVAKKEGRQAIAVVPFGVQAQMPAPSDNIAQVISDDLSRTGQFAPLAVHELLAQPSDPLDVNLNDWQTAGIPYLVIGNITSNPMGYSIKFHLFDVFKKTQLVGKNYLTEIGALRYTIHQISDEIYQAITGVRGISSTRIAYVTARRNKDHSKHRLYIADADGANSHMMLESKEPILSPAWSPDGKQVAYVSYTHSKSGGKKMVVYVQNVRTGQRRIVSDKKGLNAAPTWSPNGTQLALSLSMSGNPEIYILDLVALIFKRLTNDSAIDTEPSWSPDGKSLIFTSDRSGKPQIYQVSAQGGQARRLTFEGDYNAHARFSPDGKQLVMEHDGKIALLNLQNNQLDILTHATLDESPSFSPNGQMIIYTSGSSLSAISVDGRVHHRLAEGLGEEVREPAWSPFD